MSKTKYRVAFFGMLLDTQAAWLNRQAAKGWRLVRTGRLLYAFERCEPGRYQYAVDFVGEKSSARAREYRALLEDTGCRVFTKNANLNLSLFKARWRPWAEKGGRIATNPGTFGRELVIVEKEQDGKPFALHTSYEDKAEYYRTLRGPWLTVAALALMGLVVNPSAVFAVLAVLAAAPALFYHRLARRMDKAAQTQEW